MIIKKQPKKIQDKVIETQEPEKASQVEDDKIDLFDIDNIDFSQRSERRRGDRRRGYRRIDDRNLISRAQEESDKIKESSAKEGYKEGLEKSKQDLEEVKHSINKFMNAENEVFEYIAPDILQISVDIARKIIKKEIEQDPQLILGNILDVLKGLSKDEKRVSIKVNPDDVQIIKENIPDMIESNGLEIKVSTSADENISPGGCVFYTDNGVVDASIDTQLEIIKEALKGL